VSVAGPPVHCEPVGPLGIILAIVAVCALLLLVWSATRRTSHVPPERIVVGGVYASRGQDGRWRVSKVIERRDGVVVLRLYANRFDDFPADLDPADLVLGMTLESLDTEDLGRVPLGIARLPIAEDSFWADDRKLITTTPVTQEEIGGSRTPTAAYRSADPASIGSDREDVIALARDLLTSREAGNVMLRWSEVGRPLPPRDAADDLVRRPGYAPLGDSWVEVPRTRAREILAKNLSTEAAYDTPQMSLLAAEALADRFLDLVGSNAVYFTNHQSYGGCMPLTRATFDSGVVAVAPDRVGMVWTEDED
jgi:hypothetical protein